MEKDKIEQLEKILKGLEAKHAEALNQCKEIISHYCSNGQYHCNYSRSDYNIDELSIDDVKSIVRDYKNDNNKRKKDDYNANIRQTMTGRNKYGPGNEYGK